jgi:hypothetical protein
MKLDQLVLDDDSIACHVDYRQTDIHVTWSSVRFDATDSVVVPELDATTKNTGLSGTFAGGTPSLWMKSPAPQGCPRTPVRGDTPDAKSGHAFSLVCGRCLRERTQSPALPNSVTEEQAEKDERNDESPRQCPPGSSTLLHRLHSGLIALSGRTSFSEQKCFSLVSPNAGAGRHRLSVTLAEEGSVAHGRPSWASVKSLAVTRREPGIAKAGFRMVQMRTRDDDASHQPSSRRRYLCHAPEVIWDSRNWTVSVRRVVPIRPTSAKCDQTLGVQTRSERADSGRRNRSTPAPAKLNVMEISPAPRRKEHRRSVWLEYTILSPRPAAEARFATNYFNETWHVITSKQGAITVDSLRQP